jgi:hypothetical protein
LFPEACVSTMAMSAHSGDHWLAVLTAVPCAIECVPQTDNMSARSTRPLFRAWSAATSESCAASLSKRARTSEFGTYSRALRGLQLRRGRGSALSLQTLQLRSRGYLADVDRHVVGSAPSLSERAPASKSMINGALRAAHLVFRRYGCAQPHERSDSADVSLSGSFVERRGASLRVSEFP